VHQQTGIRLVFDNLHHRLNNPSGCSEREALAMCLATWPTAERAKIHFSTPRTEWLVTAKPGIEHPQVRQTRWCYHSDYVNPFELIDFIRMADGLPVFDIMLEARAKDLALLQLQDDLARYAPDLEARLEQRRAASGPPTQHRWLQLSSTGEEDSHEPRWALTLAEHTPTPSSSITTQSKC
jgi:UV DNA damage endonuclease